MMKILYHNQKKNDVKVSFILIDWSCRESFHVLDYLNRQTVPRDQYEVLWIEYYAREAPEINQKLKESLAKENFPILDQWIVLGLPESSYYHKHLMYNVGILRSRGKITVICDSDVMVRPTFVESILRSFEKETDIVLHLDEVRNDNKRFYPFCSPAFEEILSGKDCRNWKNGKTTGLLDQRDPLHARNYGACMAALRDDLIRIGGADEHIHYLGHICGPYEMTFRLKNAGKKEIWHESEFLFHTWHPGTDGVRNFLGPHDGKNMSAAALEIRRTGRINPLVENQAIRLLRQAPHEVAYADPFECVIPTLEIPNWRIRQAKKEAGMKWILEPGNMIQRIRLLWLLCRLAVRQLIFKVHYYRQSRVMEKSFFEQIRVGFSYIGRMWRNNLYTKSVCSQVLDRLSREGVREISIYGNSPARPLLIRLAQSKGTQIKHVYPRAYQGQLNGNAGKIIIASLTDVIEQTKELEALGAQKENIVRLQ